MHTSTTLTASDFTFRQRHHNQHATIPFADFCPNYHELDRIGVVSPRIADGVLRAGQALLALTTAFYDCHRARGNDFFEYPQHFAFVGKNRPGKNSVGNNNSGDVTNSKPTLENQGSWGAWSQLDVWPAEKWVPTELTATSMIQTIFDYQINRLFWPETIWPQPGEEPLPDYLYRMLTTRLKAIYLYSPTGDPTPLQNGHPTHNTTRIIEVTISPGAVPVLEKSYAQLSEEDRPKLEGPAPSAERFWPMPVADFINAIRSQPS